MKYKHDFKVGDKVKIFNEASRGMYFDTTKIYTVTALVDNGEQIKVRHENENEHCQFAHIMFDHARFVLHERGLAMRNTEFLEVMKGKKRLLGYERI